jgi:hypothetical protein
MALTEAISYNPLDDIQKRQVIQENQMKLQEMKRMMEEAAQGRALEQEMANMPMPGMQQQPPMQGPVGMEQAPEMFMAPSGAPAPSFMAGPQMEEQMKKPSAVGVAKQSAVELAQMQDRLGQIKSIAQEMRKKGLIDYANKYEERYAKMEQNFEDVKGKHLQNVAKTFEITAGIANGYLDAIENDADPDQAWMNLVQQSAEAGVGNVEKLMSIPPQMRNQYALHVRSAAESSKDRAIAEREALKQSNLNARLTRSLELRNKLFNYKQRNDAADREFKQSKEARLLSQNEFNNEKGRLSTVISSLNSDRTSIEQDIDDINMRIAGLRSGTILTDATGGKLSKDARIAEVSMLEEQAQQLKAQKDKVSKTIEDHRNALENLKLKPGASENLSPDVATPKPSKETLPDSARAQLREGVNTTFANGQTWTLMDGKAVKVK